MTDDDPSLAPAWPPGFFDDVDRVVYSMLDSVRLFVERAHRQLDLPSERAMDVLRALAVGPTPQARLVGWLGMSAASVSRAVHECTEAGLLVQRRVPDDRRAAVLELTPDGRDIIAALNRLRTEGWNRVGEEFGHDEVVRRLAEFTELLDRVRQLHVDALAELDEAPDDRPG